MPNKCKQFEADFGSRKGLLLRFRQDRKRPHEASSLIPHGYYFLFYCFLYAPRVSVASLLQAYTYICACIRVYNASAGTHNVVVKTFYINHIEKKETIVICKFGENTTKELRLKIISVTLTQRMCTYNHWRSRAQLGQMDG